MAGSELGRRLRRWSGVATAAVLLPLACSPPPAAKPTTPADVAQPPAAQPPATRPPAAAPPAPAFKPPPSRSPAPPSRPPTVVEIEPAGAGEDERQDLVQASRLERERRKNQPPAAPIAVITNQNLDQMAKRGDLTFAEEAEGAAASAPETGSSEPREGVQEEYWRARALEIRNGWQQAVEERQDLEERVAVLRRRFYAEDDPFVRDGQIKPEWDRALERLAELKETETRMRQELDDLYEEAELAGVSGEWLDDGRELEPGADEGEDEDGEAGQELPAHQTKDPPIFEDEAPP